MIYDRRADELIDHKDFGGSQTNFLYSTVVGRILLSFISSKTFSNMRAKYYSHSRSIKMIKKIEEAYNIDKDEYAKKSFKSFDDFFIRKLKPEARPFSSKPTDFIAPADSKLTYKKISEQLTINVKGGTYSIADMLDDADVASAYNGGACLIFRLSMDDCHRYIFPDSGTLVWTKTIAGKLHTIQPIAHRKYKPYIRNYRVISNLQTKRFGDIIVVEVGALLVGRIKNHNKIQFKKGDEKGYFKLGGSTIIVLLKPKTIKIDSDIMYYSKKSIETKVKQGETIGALYV